MDYNIIGNDGGDIFNAVQITSSTQTITGIDISGFNTGHNVDQVTFIAWLTDAGGNLGSHVEGYATLNRTLPPAFSIAPNPPTIDGFSAANTGFKFSTAEVGDTYSYIVTSSGTPGTNQVSQVTGGSTVPLTSASQSVTGINVANLPNGQLTYSVTLTNPVGNSTTETGTATLEAAAPSVTPDQGTISGGAIASNGFTLANAEIGATYTYTISDSSTPPDTQTGSGTVTSAAQDITGIDLSSLADGTITYSVMLTDTAGNSTSTPITATATMDRELPAAIELSTSVAVAGASSGSRVAVLQTVSADPTATYSYTLLSGGPQFSISGDELLSNGNLGAVGTTYTIEVQSTEPSTDPQDKSVTQSFTITVGSADPVAPVLSISPATGSTAISSTAVSIAPNPSTGAVSSGTTLGSLNTLAAAGSALASQANTNYSLVSEAGVSNSNSLFKIVNGNLVAAAALQAGTYSVRVRTSGTYLISDVGDLTGVSSPYALQVSYDPTQVPSSTYLTAAVNAGLVSLSAQSATGAWSPAISANQEVAGSLAEKNVQGSYANFWNSVASGHPSATLPNVVGSSGIDTTANVAWAVVDHSGPYAVGVEVFTEQVITITVT